MTDESFAARLNDYCIRIGCTSKALADASEVSASAVSRYRSGGRVPHADGEVLHKLAAGIALLARQQNFLEGFDEVEVREHLAEGISMQRPNVESFRLRLNDLMQSLGVTNVELARYAHVDPSFLSRIRNGQRAPTNLGEYARTFSLFVARRVGDPTMAERLVELLSQSEFEKDLVDALEQQNHDEVARIVEGWLSHEESGGTVKVEQFLERLDEFDLNAYIKTIHYDELHVPTAPMTLPQSKSYYGLDGMREAELEFLKCTAMSRKSREAIMFSDMDMTDLAGDGDFMKKYAMGVAAMLKRGVILNVVHDVTRPFDEMMMGLEGWIPLYMTGQVRPYYLTGLRDGVFGHLCNSSDVASLEAECIRGHHEEGRYLFSSRREDVEYVRRRAHHLLAHAEPLMKIYRETDTARFEHFMQKEEERRRSGDGVRIGEDMFSNMSIVCYGDKQVVILKENDPRIAFVIYHPTLCNAIRNLHPSDCI